MLCCARLFYNKINKKLDNVTIYFEFDAAMGATGHYVIPQKVGKVSPHDIVMVIYDNDKGKEYVENNLHKSYPDWHQNIQIKKNNLEIALCGIKKHILNWRMDI